VNRHVAQETINKMTEKLRRLLEVFGVTVNSGYDEQDRYSSGYYITFHFDARSVTFGEKWIVHPETLRSAAQDPEQLDRYATNSLREFMHRLVNAVVEKLA